MSYRIFFLFVTGVLNSFFSFAQEVTTDIPGKKNHFAEPLSGWSNLSFYPGDLPMLQQFNDSMKREIGISGDVVLSSNSVNLPFSISALQNEFIDDEMKENVTQKLSPLNAFEFNYGGELYYRFLAGKFLFKSPALFTAGFKAASVQQAKFTDDLFNVAFFGNAGYAGQTADFSGSHNLSYNYRQFRLGIQKQFFTQSGLWEVGTALSLLTAKQGSSLDLKNVTLFTEQNGEYIDAYYNFEYFVSDSSNKGSLQTDGAGASVDLMLSYLSPGRKSRFIFYANDVGFISWNKESRIYAADSSLHFTGIEVTDLLFGNDSALFHFDVDTLLKKTGTVVTTGSHTTNFTMRFSLVYLHALSEKWTAAAGITYRPFPDLLPRFFVLPQYVFSPFLRAGFSLAYGGTSKFNLGLQGQATIGSQLSLRIGSENVLGIFMPQETTATSLFLQATIRF